MWSRFGPDRQCFHYPANEFNLPHRLTRQAFRKAEEKRFMVERADALQKWKVFNRQGLSRRPTSTPDHPVVGIASREKKHSLKSKLRERVEIPESQLFVCLLNRPLFHENVDQTINFVIPLSLPFACCASPQAWSFSPSLLRSAPGPNFSCIGKTIMPPTWVHPCSRDLLRPGEIAHLSLGISCQVPQIFRCKESFQT
jgi:hypothetical protein